MDVTRLLFVLRTTITSKSLLQGKLIHQKLVTLGLQDNIALCKNLINFYFACQHYDYAKLVFRTIENPLDISLWNGLLAAYTKNHMNIETLELFDRLLQYPHLKPDSFTYPSVLKACSVLGRDSYGRGLHANLIKSGFMLDFVIASSLVGLYAKCNLFESAIQLFDEMPDRDVASWNTIISCYYQDGKAEKALEIFEDMRQSGFEPNSVTLTMAISSCARLLDLERGKAIHKEIMKNGNVLDNFVKSALIDMYGKCGCLDLAKDIFDQMPKKTMVAWNSMISGYSSLGDSKGCIELFKRMCSEDIRPNLTTLSIMLMACSRAAQLQHGRFTHGYLIRNNIEADVFVHGGLIDMYFRCGRVQSAENVFKMLSRPNLFSWNVMISGYVSMGNYFEALALHDDMKKVGVRPDAATFSTVLSACTQLGALGKGIEIHNCVTELGLEANEIVMGSLLDMYAKCGAVDEAINVFNKLPERDIVSWTSMITAYGSHGQALEALRLFDEMQQYNAKPDAVTFLAVLSACSHAGMVDKGLYYYDQMTKKYGIEPKTEHYSCLIDLLGRAGRLREAFSFLKNTPQVAEDAGLLSTLFSACQLQKDLELGEEIAKLLIKKFGGDSSTYITLSNMYASVGKWDDMCSTRLEMKELGMKKNPGCSWIEINKRIEAFFVRDHSHPQSEMVHNCLTILLMHMEMDEMVSEDLCWF